MGCFFFPCRDRGLGTGDRSSRAQGTRHLGSGELGPHLSTVYIDARSGSAEHRLDYLLSCHGNPETTINHFCIQAGSHHRKAESQHRCLRGVTLLQIEAFVQTRG